MNCSMEFPSEEEFQAHKDSNHQTKGVPLVPPGETVDPAFIEQVQRIEQKKKEEAEQSHPVAADRPELPPSAPITLTYRYTGQCPDCRREVVTFPMDVKIKDVACHVVVAYCEGCKKQVESREEKKL